MGMSGGSTRRSPRLCSSRGPRGGGRDTPGLAVAGVRRSRQAGSAAAAPSRRPTARARSRGASGIPHYLLNAEEEFGRVVIEPVRRRLSPRKNSCSLRLLQQEPKVRLACSAGPGPGTPPGWPPDTTRGSRVTPPPAATCSGAVATRARTSRTSSGPSARSSSRRRAFPWATSRRTRSGSMHGASIWPRPRPPRARSSASSPTTTTGASSAGASRTSSSRDRSSTATGGWSGTTPASPTTPSASARGSGLASAAPAYVVDLDPETRTVQRGAPARTSSACGCWRRGSISSPARLPRRPSRSRRRSGITTRRRPPPSGCWTRHGRGRLPGAPARRHARPVRGLVPGRLCGGRGRHRAPAGISRGPLTWPRAE